MIGVAFFTPVGSFALMLLAPWTLATSVVLYRQRANERHASPGLGSSVAQAQA